MKLVSCKKSKLVNTRKTLLKVSFFYDTMKNNF
jgi:hypothetical protein